jgi:uncharacterized Zn finger protein
MAWGWRYRPYVPVAKRREQARRDAGRLAGKGHALQPIEIAGRQIVTTFWGRAWCDNLERCSDYKNRLPRGRTYVRNGSVVHLEMRRGKVEAIVSGSELYQVAINIVPLPKRDWKQITRECSLAIDSLMDLLQGRFSEGVMQRLTRPRGGLLPQPREISIDCSCPDWATLCKHAAAVLYGVGSRLDVEPELLFLLRGVEHTELIRHAVDDANLDMALASESAGALSGEDLGELFGIELDAGTGAAAGAAPPVGEKTSRRRRQRAEAKPPNTKSAARSSARKRSAKSPAKQASTREASGRSSTGKQTASGTGKSSAKSQTSTKARTTTKSRTSTKSQSSAKSRTSGKARGARKTRKSR